jgi:8-amino-7-oxononanoate synthase
MSATRGGAGPLDSVADERLAEIRRRGTHRKMRVVGGAQGPHMQVDGRDVVLFAGSNYLDLAHHEAVVEASVRASRDSGCAAAGSRLINGNLAGHEALEAELADFFGREAALAFNTGYMANVGVIPALIGPGDVLVSDALNHASIVDGAKLSRAEVRVFRHSDVDHLAEVLASACDGRRRVLLVVDGIYSMDGDLAPLAEIVRLAQAHGAISMVDDAHGTGTLGAGGRGSAEHAGVLADVDIVMGTLGKSLGSFGAFVAGSHKLRELLVNTARSFIFSCALAPPQVEASRAALRLIDGEPWRRWALQANAGRLRDRLARSGLATEPSSTHIVPVVIGDAAATMAVCEELLVLGYYAQGIRHPSVARGAERLRVTVMASHSRDEIDGVADAIAERVASHRGTAAPLQQIALG